MNPERSNDEMLTVSLRRGQWRVILAAASDYNSRVPHGQGDGGACLDTIKAAIDSGGRINA